MGSSSSRHAAGSAERRDRGDHSGGRREVGGITSGGSTNPLDQPACPFRRCTPETCSFESQTHAGSGHERSSGTWLFPSRQSSIRRSEGHMHHLDPLVGAGTTPRSHPSSSNCEPAHLECCRQDRTVPPHTVAEASSSNSGTTLDLSRTNNTGRLTGRVTILDNGVGMESESSRNRSHNGRANVPLEADDASLEGHSAWSSASSVQGNESISHQNSQVSFQQLQRGAPTAQHSQVDEGQERSGRCADLPSSLDRQDSRQRRIFATEPLHTPGQQGLGFLQENAYATVGSGQNEIPPLSTQSSMPTWGTTEEGRLLEYRHSVFAESWDRHLALRGSDVNSGMSDWISSPPGEASGSTPAATPGRESRRSGGRRLWDALTRAANHRRTTTPMTISLSEGFADNWGQTAEEQLDATLFGRNLDLEERRRRVRSQVWALQLLSNGLEGMPGPPRRCAAGGHHHGGHCSCELYSSSEDTSTRASISRIIMLAEALFEVLDEIHRQSVALSLSSIPVAALPAPDTVVNAIPIRKVTQKVREDGSQCNICLVEYEEGDQVRVLPCHHEYHVACVDKWLKEVHRVCPLCRGNVCDKNPAMPLPIPM